MTSPIKESFPFSGAEKIISAFMEISVALGIIAVLGTIFHPGGSAKAFGLTLEAAVFIGLVSCLVQNFLATSRIAKELEGHNFRIVGNKGLSWQVEHFSPRPTL